MPNQAKPAIPADTPQSEPSTFASRKAEREAREAMNGPTVRRARGTIRAGIDAPQPVIVVTHA